jgi:hypothetical protein
MHRAAIPHATQPKTGDSFDSEGRPCNLTLIFDRQRMGYPAGCRTRSQPRLRRAVWRTSGAAALGLPG